MIKMLYEVLVQVEQAYADTYEFKTGDKIFVENINNDVVNTIRYGRVIESPILINNIIQKDDEIYFHHNIVRKTVDWEGKELTGMFDFDRSNGLFRCPLEEIFAIVREGKFIAISPFCFIKPINKKEIENCKGFLIKHISSEIEQYGIVKYSNDDLRAQNVKEGDIVIFSKDSEYKYNVYGEDLYRMKTTDILCKVEGKHGLENKIH